MNTINPFLKKLPHTKYFSIQQTSIRGTPDYLICVMGCFVGMEVKDDDNPKGLDPLQKDNKFLIERAGGLHISVSQTGKSPGTISWEKAVELLTVLSKGEMKWASR